MPPSPYPGGGVLAPNAPPLAAMYCSRVPLLCSLATGPPPADVAAPAPAMRRAASESPAISIFSCLRRRSISSRPSAGSWPRGEADLGRWKGGPLSAAPYPGPLPPAATPGPPRPRPLASPPAPRRMNCRASSPPARAWAPSRAPLGALGGPSRNGPLGPTAAPRPAAISSLRKPSSGPAGGALPAPPRGAAPLPGPPSGRWAGRGFSRGAPGGKGPPGPKRPLSEGVIAS